MLTEEERQQAIDLLMRLVSIPSESGSELEVSEFIMEWLMKKGFDSPRTDSVGNVRASTGRTEPVLLYCGHMDTVPGRIPVRRVGNKIFGRGSSDAKGPLAAMLYSASLLAKRNTDNGVAILAVVGEETGSTGIRRALEDGINQKYAVFGEPSGFNNIVIGYRGRLEVNIEFTAPSFHASKPWVGRSALQCAVDFSKSVEGLWKDSAGIRKFDTVSATVTRLVSGVAGNVAPPRAALTLDLRYPPGLDQNKFIEELEELAKECAGTASFRMNVVEASGGVIVETSARLVRAMRRAIFHSTRVPATCVKKTGSGDMNHAVRFGIESITYGPGSTSDEHSDEESIDITDYLRAIEVLTRLPEELSNVRTGKENIGQ
ncbi:MAG: M20/M25/M40 family metallo-hydrolase [Nitrososphaerota archaeon]|jgi:LysW-gamma-L-lysine carboxypeptidase|nr:M20/M25/M40 family metallo-hydrolase [Nitrososphaerota archaeon]